MPCSWHMPAHSKCLWKAFKEEQLLQRQAWGQHGSSGRDFMATCCVFPPAVGHPQEEGAFLLLGATAPSA